ncbi:MAG: hypothetical protein ACKO37_08550 [Vampirovibrionales bacterium]
MFALMSAIAVLHAWWWSSLSYATELTILPNAPMPGPKMIAIVEPSLQTNVQHSSPSKEPAATSDSKSIEIPSSKASSPQNASSALRIQPPQASRHVVTHTALSHTGSPTMMLANKATPQPHAPSVRQTPSHATLVTNHPAIKPIASQTPPTTQASRHMKTIEVTPTRGEDIAIQTFSLSEEPVPTQTAQATKSPLPELQALEKVNQETLNQKALPQENKPSINTNIAGMNGAGTDFQLEDALDPLEPSQHQANFPWEYWLPKVGGGMTLVLGTLVGLRYVAKKVIKPEAVTIDEHELINTLPSNTTTLPKTLHSLAHLVQTSKQASQKLSARQTLDQPSSALPRRLTLQAPFQPSGYSTEKHANKASSESLSPAKQRLLDALNSLNQ